MTISGHPLSRLHLLATQHDQTSGLSYYMEGKHERAVDTDWFSSAGTFMENAGGLKAGPDPVNGEGSLV